MSSANEGFNIPSYISLQNANVHVSEARQMKLKPETHRAVNGFLDEFLYKILHSSRSLMTDRLRAGLLSVLPTAVGKEAITEAEVELRAFLASRGKVSPEDDRDTFHLQWSFELLRQKCKGYCTMSDGDEDLNIQAQINEKMSSSGSPPPKEVLLEPAGLYLAAILESTCHHVLANVGRVASRDSSRMDATPADLFVALCEDNAIYALFRTMNVYEQIENMSKGPKPRRSKSFTRGEKNSRTSSSHQDSSSTKDSPTPPPGRMSSDTSMTSTAMSSRTSIDKSRGMKKLLNSRTSNDYGDGHNGHKRSESLLSEGTVAGYSGAYEDPSTAEFDDLMRSDSTMKVSLTPDRLKTMEVYKQEKDRNRRPAPLQVGKQDSDSSSRPSPTPNGKRRPTLRNESIVEADEDSAKPHSSSSRKGSVSSSSPFPPSSGNRARSLSANSQTPPQVVRKTPSKTNLGSPPTSYTSPMPAKDFRGTQSPSEPFPHKTRKRQVNRESMDLDDVMAGSDNDDEAEPTPRSTLTSPPAKRTVKVSQSTRDLMNFLDEGPPDSTPQLSKTGRELADFLHEGPPDGATLPNDKKGSGRLQRMMSKLSLGGSEKTRQNSEDFGRGSSQRRIPTTPVKPTLSGKSSATNLSALANRPVPPRPPPISPPSSPSEEQAAGFTNGLRAAPSWERNHTPPRDGKENGHAQHSNGKVVNGDSQPSRSRIVTSGDTPQPRPLPDPKRQAGKSSSATRSGFSHTVDPPTSSHLTPNDAQELRRLMGRGTTAEECRLILDMFLAKTDSAAEVVDPDVPYPSPSSDHPDKPPQSVETALETLVVELVLQGDISTEPPVRRRKNPARKLTTPSSTTPSPNGTPTAQVQANRQEAATA